MSAILSADVKGYSRLMSADEEGTVKAFNDCRHIIARCVQNHKGRVVDSPGDNVIAEFASTVEAVKCTAKIQQYLKVRNAHLPETKRMEFRIGVNLGDVIEEDGRIYDDGVYHGLRRPLNWIRTLVGHMLLWRNRMCVV